MTTIETTPVSTKEAPQEQKREAPQKPEAKVTMAGGFATGRNPLDCLSHDFGSSPVPEVIQAALEAESTRRTPGIGSTPSETEFTD